MLPSWDPDSLRKVVPFVIGCVGARRTGKSTAISHLLFQMYDQFDLVICFIGSAACNPTIEAMMHKYWDPRFFFAEWNQPLINKLLEQQEALKRAGKRRNICILVDDVILTSSAEDQLSHMGMRGRHFSVSLILAAVSYTNLPKRVRRSLDVLLCFSCGMQGDRKILMWEYASNAQMAGFALNNLGEHECLVLQTNQRQQRLKVWRSARLTPHDFGTQQIHYDELKRRVARGTASARRSVYRSRERCGSSRGTVSLERGPVDAPQEGPDREEQSESDDPASCPETSPLSPR